MEPRRPPGAARSGAQPEAFYGRAAGFGLSDLGRKMAERLGEYFADAPLVHLVSSPLQRAQETIAPIAAGHPDLVS